MGDLFHQLGRHVDRNARRAVRVYQRELPDFRRVDAGGGGLAAMLDFAVILRRRTTALAAEGQPFTDDDLRYMESVGQERGERGVSAGAQRQVLMLHSTLTLQEIRESNSRSRNCPRSTAGSTTWPAASPPAPTLSRRSPPTTTTT